MHEGSSSTPVSASTKAPVSASPWPHFVEAHKILKYPLAWASVNECWAEHWLAKSQLSLSSCGPRRFPRSSYLQAVCTLRAITLGTQHDSTE